MQTNPFKRPTTPVEIVSPVHRQPTEPGSAPKEKSSEPSALPIGLSREDQHELHTLLEMARQGFNERSVCGVKSDKNGFKERCRDLLRKIHPQLAELI